MKTLFGILFLLILVPCASITPVFAQEETEDVDRYDVNTEITVTGTVSGIEQRARGPVFLTISRGAKSYVVVTAPRRYLAAEGMVFETAEQLQVTGSRYWGRDGRIYVSAKTVRRVATNEVMTLRDDTCRPMWGKGSMRRGR